MKRLFLALLLFAAPALAQNRIITQATAAQFFPANDARYFNVSGDTVTGLTTLRQGTGPAEPAIFFGPSGVSLWSGNTYLGLSASGVEKSILFGNGIALQRDGTLSFSTSDTDAEAAAGVMFSGSAGALRFSGGALGVAQLTTVQRDALTPAAGDIIYNTTASRFQMYNGATWHEWLRRDGTDTLPAGRGSATLTPTGVITRQLSDVATDDGSEKILFTYTVPAGTLLVDGQGLRLEFRATTAANANTKNVLVYAQSTSLAANLASMGAGGVLLATFYIYRASSTSVVVERTFAIFNTSIYNASSSSATVAVSDLASNTFVVKITGTGVAANDIVLDRAVLRYEP